ncbi:MAG: PspC domain-containing protein [Sphingosinicella sp.]|uniref:PspC domain-containing protein n=1 Tax=Sphingosinicella sp. TaxID=1917971 RepID=UPI004037852C
MRMRGRFAVDKDNGKLLGVCSGIAAHTGVDATIIRIGFGLFAILGSFVVACAAYLILGYIGNRQRRSAPDYARISAGRGRTREESRERMRNLDLRMQAVETYVTSSNSRLAREIEDLR